MRMGAAIVTSIGAFAAVVFMHQVTTLIAAGYVAFRVFDALAPDMTPSRPEDETGC